MQNIKKYFMTLALLLTAVGGAWAGGLEGRTFVDFKIEFRENPYTVILPASHELPAGVLVDGTSYNGMQHGVIGGTITVPVDGPVKFTIGACQFSQNEIVVKKDGEAFTTVNNQATCGEKSGSFAQYVTYVYNGKAATLTFEFIGNTYIPYFFAEAVEGSIEVTWDPAAKTGTFTMPAFDVDVSYELVRDMTVDVDATIAERIRIQKENNAYEAVTATELIPAVSDKISGTAVAMTATTDYTAQLQKKTEGDNPTWADATTLSVGTFRYVITGTGLYDGKITTNEFQLFEGYEVTIPAGEYATYFKDEALYVENENAQLYTISSVTESEAVLSDAITVAPANTPLLVYNKSEKDKTFLLIPTTDKTPDNVTAATQFVGTLVATTIPASATGADNYALNGYAFVWVKTAIEVGANKCWLHIASQPAAARAMTRSIVGGGDTTGIDAIENVTIDNEGWYDLQGRKLQAKPNRGGIYIHNGKKVVVRK